MKPNELVSSRTSTRRRVLAAACTGISAAAAGCLGDDEADDAAGADGADDGTDDVDGTSDADADEDADDGTSDTDETDDESDTEESEALVGVSVGTLAEGVDLSDSQTVQDSVASELDLDEHEVRVWPDEVIVEVFDDVSESALLDALDASDVETANAEVRSAVTDETLQSLLATVEVRLEETDIDASVAEHEDRHAVVFDGPDADPDTLEDILDIRRVEIAVSYPDPDADEPVVETVFTGTDVVSVAAAQAGENGQPHVPVELSDEAASRFATTLTENDFTTDGVGQCTFDDGNDPDPDPEEYCILTRVDGDILHGASLGPSLAEAIEDGAFERDPSFVIQTTTREEAQQLELAIRSGELPTRLELESAE